MYFGWVPSHRSAHVANVRLSVRRIKDTFALDASTSSLAEDMLANRALIIQRQASKTGGSGDFVLSWSAISSIIDDSSNALSDRSLSVKGINLWS